MLRYLGCAVAAAALTAGTAQAAANLAADGPADRGGPVNVRIGLSGRDPRGLEEFARAVSTPGNPQYGKYLTPEQARERFGPTGGQVAAVREWLRTAGMHVTEEAPHWIDANGNAAAARRAFGSGMRTLAAPAAVAGAVANVAVIGQARGVGVREGASGAIRSRGELGPSRGGSEGGARVAGHVDEGVAVGRAHSDGVGPAGSSASSTSSGPANPGTASTPTAPKPAKTHLKCSPTWGALTADPKLPPGYSTPEPLDVCGYVPSQLRTAYGVATAGLTGTGVTIAIVDAYGSPTMRADADRFARAHGDAPFTASQYSESVTPSKWRHTDDGVCQSPADWAGEEALDVETAHGMAPGATIKYFGANSCSDEDINAVMAQIVDKHAADMVSASFGEVMHRTSGSVDPAIVAQATQLFQYGAAEGIGFYYATGDCGDNSVRTGASCDPESARAQTDWPVSSPWVTAVGGTALALGPGSKPLWEATMGDRRSVLSDDGKSWVPFPGDFYFGGGGGTSEDFAQPDYQRGVVPDKLAHTLLTGKQASGPMRTLPDIAMDGDLMTAVLVGVTDAKTGAYSEVPVGGTSASTPMFVAVQADAQQARLAAGGKALGFANPVIYQRAKQPVFTDVVAHPPGAPADISTVLDLGPDEKGKPRIRLFELGHDEGLPAGPGYDLATGFGSPRAEYLESFKH
ncbi:MAG: S8 family serine peptidase [Catenulispora sp.]|nr:S8 family serine peptidase [Catenulispora sp.]